MKVTPILAITLAMISLSLPACNMNKEAEAHEEPHKIVATSPETKDVTITQPYVCVINSKNHIEVQARAFGVLEEIPVKEGQAVKTGDVLFRLFAKQLQGKLDAELGKLKRAQLERDNTKRLAEKSIDGKAPVVSQQELALYEANLLEAQGNVAKAEAELAFATIRAPFDGIIDRQEKQLGSTIKEGEILTTLSDNSVMWVRFNVPEKRYFEYMASWGNSKKGSQIELVDAKIELMLANGCTFKHSAGNFITLQGDFNRETGNISFRADFPNPEGLLRHGQTGTILIHRSLKNAIVIPQRATFEILDKQYVWVIDKDDKVHQREITVMHEMDDIFVIKKGLDVNDKIILEGVRQVHEGQKVEFEFVKPEEALSNQKHHAE